MDPMGPLNPGGFIRNERSWIHWIHLCESIGVQWLPLNQSVDPLMYIVRDGSTWIHQFPLDPSDFLNGSIGFQWIHYVDPMEANGFTKLWHFRQITCCKRTCYFVKDIQRRRALYLSLIRSQFEHCSPIWRPVSKTMLDKLEGLQKRCIRWILSEGNIKYNSNIIYIQKCR